MRYYMSLNPKEISLIIEKLSYRTEGFRNKQGNTAHINFICREFVKDHKNFVFNYASPEEVGNKKINNYHATISEIKKVHSLILELERITLTKSIWSEIKLKYFSLFERNYGQNLRQLSLDFKRLIEWEEKQLEKSKDVIFHNDKNQSIIILSNTAEIYEYFTGKGVRSIQEPYKNKDPYGEFYDFSKSIWSLIYNDCNFFGYYFNIWSEEKKKFSHGWLKHMMMKFPDWKLNKDIINSLSIYSDK